MKIKIFRQKQEREINQFIADHDVMTDRIMYQKDKIILSYFDKEERIYGMSKESILETLSGSLEKAQAQYVTALEAFKFWRIKAGLKTGGKEKRQIQEDQLRQHTSTTEDAMAHIKIIRKLIKEVQDGELDLG